MNSQPNVMLSILIALLIHIAIAYLVYWRYDAEPVRLGEMGQTMEIALDQGAYQSLLQKQAIQKQQVLLNKEVIKPIKPKKMNEIKRENKKVINQKVDQQPEVETASYQVKDKAVEEKAHVTEEQVEVSKEVSTKEVAAVTAEQSLQTEQISNQQQGAEGDRKTNNQNPLDMRDNATQRYLAQLMRHLQRYKQYPALLKKNHIEGKPVVRFSINKSGHVTNLEVKRHTPYAELDQAAMEVFRRASPLPKIPSELGRETLTMSLPIEYSLINE